METLDESIATYQVSQSKEELSRNLDRVRDQASKASLGELQKTVETFLYQQSDIPQVAKVLYSEVVERILNGSFMFTLFDKVVDLKVGDGETYTRDEEGKNSGDLYSNDLSDSDRRLVWNAIINKIVYVKVQNNKIVAVGDGRRFTTEDSKDSTVVKVENIDFEDDFDVLSNMVIQLARAIS